MKKQEDIERKAKQTLNSLDNLQPLEVNDFLYSRIKNRMERNEHYNVAHRKNVLFKLAAVLVLFVGINFLSFYVLNKPDTRQTAKTESGIDSFAQAYGLNTNSDSY